MERKDLKGFIPAVVTPFTQSGEIDEAAFRSIVDGMIAIGAQGICVAGDNGESWALSVDERGRLTALAVEAAAGRTPVVTGVSAPTLDTCVSYARAAAENGADAVLLLPPTYVMKGSPEEVLRRFSGVARAVDLPIVAYNSPRRAGHSLPLDLIARLIDETPVIGIKESDRDFARLCDLISQIGDRLQVLVGPAYYILPGIALGAAGFIATGPELLGEDAGRLLAMGREKPDEHFRRTQQRLTHIYQTLMGTGTWPAALKAALASRGLPAGFTRDPVMMLDEAAARKLAAELADLNLDQNS